MITVTRTQTLLQDNDGDGQYDPGDTIQIVLTIANTNATALTGLSFTDTLGGGTLVAGSFRIGPIAVDDSFTAAGNTPVTFTAAQLLANDVDPDSAAGLTVVSVSNAQHGTIVDNGNGTYTFTPATGYTGAATFDYVVRDSDGLTSASVGTTTVNITSQVWYVDSNASASGADGSFAHPFTTLAPFNGAGGNGDTDAAGDTLVVHGAVSANLVLEAGQKLYGDGSTLIVNGVQVTSGSGSTAITAASGNIVTLSTDNIVDGFTVTGANGTTTGLIDNGGSVTSAAGKTAVLSHLNFTGNGQAVAITHGGNLDASIGSLSTTGGATALNLAGTASSGTGLLSGSLSVASGTATGTASAVKIGSGAANSGGTIAVSYNGAINATGTNAVDVNNHATGTVSFGGNITANTSGTGISVSANTSGAVAFTGQSLAITTGSATAVNVANNTGAAISFASAGGGNGLDIVTGSGTGMAFTGGGTLDVQGSGNSIQTVNGPILNFANGAIGAGGVAFAGLGASSAVAGTAIALTNVDGNSFNGGAVSVAGAAVAGIAVTGGSSTAATFGNTTITTGLGGGQAIVVSGNTSATGAANVTFAGTVVANSSSGSGRAVFIDNNAGSVAFTGTSKAITAASGSAVEVSNNGAAVSFTGGGLAATATSGAGLRATAAAPGGGSLTIGGSGNTSSTTTGTGVYVSNVNEAITLQRVSVSNAATNGIYLSNAGNGGFAITGTAATAGSGGTIAATGASAPDGATGGIGVYLNAVGNVQLSNLNLTGNWSNFGIRGDNVATFGLHDSTVSGTFGNAGGVDEAAIRFGAQAGGSESASGTSGITGTGVFDGNTIGGGYEDNLDLYLYGSASANISVRDSATRQAIFNATQNPGPDGAGNDNIHLESGGTANLTATITGVDVNGAHGDQLQVVAADSTTQSVAVTNSTFNNAANSANALGGGVYFGGGGAASGYASTFTFSGNTVTGAKDTAAAFIYDGQAATVSGLIANNTIGTAGGGAGSDGSGSANGNAIEVDAQHLTGNGAVKVAVRIDGNRLYDWANTGIALYANSQDGGSNRLEATVTNNIVAQGNDTAGLAGIYALVGGVGDTDASLLGLTLTGNTVTPPQNALSSVFLDQFNTNPIAHYYIPEYTVTSSTSHGENSGGTASAALGTFWGATNTLGTPPSGPRIYAYDTIGITNTAFSLGTPVGATPAAPAPVEPTPITQGPAPEPALSSTDAALAIVPADPTVEAAPLAPVPVEARLSQQSLDMIVAAAIDRWAQAGASVEQIAAMRGVKVGIADMTGDHVGYSGANGIAVDVDAGGVGWFVDATPRDDGEFVAIKGRWLAAADGAMGHVDLLTVVLHELGHQVGLSDSYAGASAAGLMYGYLDAGERRLPAASDVAAATGTATAETGYVLGPRTIAASLPPGKSVNVYYQATVDAIAAPGATGFTNSATVSGTNFANVTSNTQTLVVDSLSLGNLVFRDANRDGLFGAGESGIAGVTVNLYADANNDDVADGAAIATTTTAAGGVYSFAGLGAGNYIVGIDRAQAAMTGLFATRGGADPDDNVDGDSNGVAGAGTIVYSKAITLAYNSEPTPGTGNDTNLTLDLGFLTANTAPTFAATGAQPSYAENAAPVAIAAGVSVADAETSTFAGGTLTAAITGGAQAGDTLSLPTSGNVQVNGGVVTVGGTQIGTVTAQSAGSVTITFTTASPSSIVALTQAIGFLSTSDNPTAVARTVTFTLVDGLGADNGGSDRTSFTRTVSVVPSDDAPVLGNDTATVREDATGVSIAVLGNDTDVDGPAPAVRTIAGQAVVAGGSVTLASGAIVTLNGDGTLSYNPNGKFAYLVSAETAAITHAVSSATDSFTYGVQGGTTATVAVTVTGVDGPGDELRGTAGNDAIIGTSAADYVDLSQGGADSVSAGDGNDSIYFGVAFGAGDMVDGGNGSMDQIGLRGSYVGGNALNLTAANLLNTETVALLSGGATPFGYDITLGAGITHASAELVVYAGELGASESLTLNAAAATGPIRTFGGLGADRIVGTNASDAFYFGPNGRFDPARDFVDGGAGTIDQIGIDGDYGVGPGGPLHLNSASNINVETFVLLKGLSGADNHFNIVVDDNWVAPGETKLIYAVETTTGVTIDASAESDAAISIWGGSGTDTITGGALGDVLFGGAGADRLTGGGGADTFLYNLGDSAGATYDTLVGFDGTQDRLDLPGGQSITALDAASSGRLDSVADFATLLSGMAANHAVTFTATSGALSGAVFLIANDGAAGYADGTDFLVRLESPVAPLTDISHFV